MAADMGLFLAVVGGMMKIAALKALHYIEMVLYLTPLEMHIQEVITSVSNKS